MPPESLPIPVIAVETSGSLGSVAIGLGEAILAEEAFDARNNHGVALLPAVDRLVRGCGFSPQAIHQIYVSAGPGSFTGLRIGLTLARTLAYAANAQVVRVPSLEVIAQNAMTLPDPPRRIAVLLDAKRNHVFAACFERAGTSYAPIDEPAEREPVSYLTSLGVVGVLGEGAVRHAAALARCPMATRLPDALHAGKARVVYALGRVRAAEGAFTSMAELTPIYIRRPEAEERWESRQGGGATSGAV